MNLILKAYYDMLDDSASNPEWVRKIEEEIGQSIHYLVVAMDESVRDSLVANSEYFARFVSILTFKYYDRMQKSKSISNEIR